jgi:hypothetical protein
MLRMNREVERLVFLNPRDTKRQGTSLNLSPSRAFRDCSGYIGRDINFHTF